MDQRDIDNRFKHHPPQNDETLDRYMLIRQACQGLAEIINADVPESREKTFALDRLEEVMFWSNAAIARNT